MSTDLVTMVGGRKGWMPLNDFLLKEEVPGGNYEHIANWTDLGNIMGHIENMREGMSGDMVFKVTPAAVNAEIADQNDNEAQVLTATVVGAVAADGAGDLLVTVTARGMTNSPKEVTVAVAHSDNAAAIAGKIRTALTADADVSNTGSSFFTVSGSTDEVILTANSEAPPDYDMDIAIDVNDVGEADDSDIGVSYVIDPYGHAHTRYVQVSLETADGSPHQWYNGTVAVTIAETTDGDGTAHLLEETLTMDAGHAQATVYLNGTWAAGVPDTNTLSVTEATILGYTVSAVTSVETSVDTP